MTGPKVATERLYHNADKSELVLEGDERAAFLAYPVGAEIAADELELVPGSSRKRTPKPADKAISAPDGGDKSQPHVEVEGSQGEARVEVEGSVETVPVPDELDTAAKVIDWVGDDKARAQGALAAELGRGESQRKGIVKRARKVLELSD